MLYSSDKKAVGPLVTTILLLVATVSAYIAFHSWYQTYSSDFLTQVTPVVSEDSVKFLDLDGVNLWVRSYANNDFTYNDIKINGVSCSVNGTILKKSINNLSIGTGSCFSGYTTGVNEVVIYSDSGVFSSKINAHDGGVPTPLLALSSNATVIEFGEDVNLSWQGLYVSACSVSGAWSGNRNTTDSEVQSNLLVSSTFNINCSGVYGNVSDSVEVIVCASGQSIEEGTCVSGVTLPAQVYSLSNSLKFNDDDSAYLSRTPSVEGDRRVWTWSGWVKRGNLGTWQILMEAGSTFASNYALLRFRTDDTLEFDDATGTQQIGRITNRVFRDPNTWEHIVVSVDTTDSTASDRIKIYINGVEETSFSTTTNPSQNYEGFINDNILHSTRNPVGSQYPDYSLSDVYFIDGQALNASYFGQTDEWGNWVPKNRSNFYNYGEDLVENDSIQVFTSSDTQSGLTADRAADGDTTTQFASANGASGKWWQVQFNESKQVEKFSVHFRQEGDSTSMSSIAIKGSNDGSNFDTLWSGSNPNSNSGEVIVPFTFNNSNNYTYYRFEKTGGTSGTAINVYEFHLYEKSSLNDYGINGFYLPFNNSVDLGRDLSVSHGDDYQVLLIHSNNSDGDTTFLDYTNSHTITANGDVKHETNSSKFQGSSIYFDGSGDYLSIPDSNEFDFGSGDFTIDTWVKFNSFSTNQLILTKWNVNRQYHLAYTTASGLWFEWSIDNGCGASCIHINYTWSDRVVDQWYHIAVARSGSTIKMFIDGVEVTSGSITTIYDSTDSVLVGVWPGPSSSFNGYIDELRVTKGKALWTTNFTPDTTPYSPISKPDNSFTVNNIEEGQGLLIHSNSTDDSTNFFDSSSRAHVITANGDVKHETNSSKFNSSSIYFDGSGDYLTISDDGDFTLGNLDFTIDLWVYRVSGQPAAYFGNTNTGAGRKGFRCTIDDSGRPECYASTVDSSNDIIEITSTPIDTIPLNQWSHMAFVRKGSTSYLFVNGTLVKSDTSASGTIPTNGNLNIGMLQSSGTPYYSSGHIDEFRIIKGKALWTTNFTPPTQPATVLDSPSEDQVIDTPTDNFATMNPIDKNSDITLSNGNLDLSKSNDNVYDGVRSTLAMNSGKWYWEFSTTSNTDSGYHQIGMITGEHSLTGDITNAREYVSYYGYDGKLYYNGTTTGVIADYTDNDIIGFAYDADNDQVWVSVNGTWGQGDPNSLLDPPINVDDDEYFVYDSLYGTTASKFNFGQLSSLNGNPTTYNSSAGGSFVYTPPTGFKALSVNNIRSQFENITPSDYFDVLTWTGDGTASRAITGLSFQPDFIWLKNRDVAYYPQIHDVNRGASAGALFSSEDQQEDATSPITSFDSNGFTTVSPLSDAQNGNAEDLVGWFLKAGGTPVENTDGTITSHVSAADHGGFSIVNYTGNGVSGGTVGLGLTKDPKMVIVKQRDGGSGPGWYVWTPFLTDNTYYLRLELSGAQAAGNSEVPWKNTAPTSSVMTLGNTGTWLNDNGDKLVAYAFSDVPGFSKIGTYEGNADADGPFVYTGFKPRFVMIKNMDSGSGAWVMYDSERSPYNPVAASSELYADQTTIEATRTNGLDFLSNGFKLRESSVFSLNTAHTFVYIAFAEVPMAGTPAPFVNLTANTTTIEYGSSVNLTWDSNYVANCEASGDWSGLKDTTSTQVLTQINSTSTYTLTCNGSLTQGSDSVTITVCAEGEVISPSNECIEPFAQSLMFEDDDSSYLSWTPSGAPDSRKVMTFSTWFKLGELPQGTGDKNLFTGGAGNNDWIRFSGGASEGVFEIGFAGTSSGDIKTNMKFRDPSAWSNLVVSFNTSESVSSERVKVYLDGSRITDFSIETYPSQDFDMDFITNSQVQTIGARSDPTLYFDGYMSDVHVVDGLSLNPETFGYKDAYGVWQPKFPSSSFNVDSLISGATGTPIGNMVDAGGLSAAFDGSVNAAASSARVSSVTRAIVGKDWGSGNTKTIVKFILKAPSDNNFGGSSPATVILQGSNDNSSWQDLYTDDSVTNTGTGNIIFGAPSLDNQVPYRYHRIVIDKTSASTNNVGELEFYETGEISKDYGTNGFYLPFADSSNIGKDYSGNSNSFTANNLASSDVTEDNPVSNYATLNPLNMQGGNTPTLSQGNLHFSRTGTASDNQQAYGTLAASGKNYFEYYVESSSNGHSVGWMEAGETSGDEGAGAAGWDAEGYQIQTNWNSNNYLILNRSSQITDESDKTGLYWKFAIDTDAKKIWLGSKTNDSWFDSSGNSGPFNESSPTATYTEDKNFFPYIFTHAQTETGIFNFGQNQSGTTWCESATGYFKYCPPSGFKALSVTNINNATGKVNASEYFDIVTYLGTAADKNITSLAFSPDITWIKNRDQLDGHVFYDSLRGATKVLNPHNANNGSTEVNGLTAFLANGFSLGSDHSVNGPSENMVAWNFKENSSVLDILTYTGTGSAHEVSHALNSSPEMVIVKKTDQNDYWATYFRTLGPTSYLNLDTTSASMNGAPLWDSTDPNSTSFRIGTSYEVNEPSRKYIAYLFSEVPGFSKIGSYSGNSNADGTFIYTGFKPAFVMIKRTDSTSPWTMYDTSRKTYNVNDKAIEADADTQEQTHTTGVIDILSNGFKARGASTYINTGSYVYIAFAENPLR